MAGLQDFLQGASNSVASNVSAPVDGLAWLLRKAGVPIPSSPVGGSDWMAQQGFTREPESRGMGLLGEAIGGVAPMLVAAKAPQIARGLLQGADNLAASRTMNPQTGAIVWHGSPHKFDKFDASKIGTGEGAQAYGHGLYLAESPNVAKQYADNVKDMGAVTRINAELSDLAKRMNADEIPGAYRKYRTDAGRQAAQRYDELMAAKEGVRTAPGSMYKVDLPDEHIAKMLDFDNPLFEQPARVQEMANLWGITKKGTGDIFGNHLLAEAEKRFGGAEGAADALRARGIPGIRFLDGNSRGAGAGTSNYVVFPGNEGLLNILERNGMAP